MTDEEDGSDYPESGFESISEEREYHYPDEGFALVEIDMMKPPGEALTRLSEELRLSDLDLPAPDELVDYVIYDSNGRSYGHEDIGEIEAKIEEGHISGVMGDLGSEDLRTRRLAYHGLQKAAEEHPAACLDAIPLLTADLEDSLTDIQAAALGVLTALAETHPDQVTPASESVLDFLEIESPPKVKRDAVVFIAAVSEHDPGALVDAPPKLAALLQSGTKFEGRVLNALNRIAKAYPDAVVPVAPELHSYLQKGSDSQRVGALAVLGMIAKEFPEIAENTIPILEELIQVDDFKLRANAAGLLTELTQEYPDRVEPIVPAVITLLNDDDEKARYNATSILARMAKKHPKAVEPATESLIGILDDDFPFSRGNACWALGHLRAEPARQRLREIRQHDPSEEVQEVAGWAIEQIDRDR